MEWQPIETAPKDGSLVLLFREGWDVAYVAAWAVYPDAVDKSQYTPLPWEDITAMTYYRDTA